MSQIARRPIPKPLLESFLIFAFLAAGCAASVPLLPSAELDTEEAAWSAFCKQLEAAGIETLRAGAASHAVDRAEGLRYLVEQMAASAQQVVLERETGFPLLRFGATNVGKWGLDGADVRYSGSAIESGGTYRLSGRAGSAALFALQVSRLAGGYEAFASLANEAIGADPQGRFEVRIARERPEDWDGVWLPLHERADHLLIREYFGEWDDMRPAELVIERIDAVAASPLLTVGEARRMLDEIAAHFATRAPQWLPRVQKMRKHLLNRFVASDAESQGLGDNVYGSGWYRVADDEALLVELDAPDALLWSFQLGNLWWQSHDYITRTGSINGAQAVAGSDGRYRIVVAHEDPGVPNWLDTGGRPEGAMLYRFQQSRTRPEPTLRLVPLAELRAALPADTPRVSPDQRAAQIEARRAHASRRWSP